MAEPNDFQLLSLFVRDHSMATEPVTLSPAELRRLVSAIAANLRIGTQFVDIMRSLEGKPPYVATYEETYGESEPKA